MGLTHKALPIWGVQFHPEAILTQAGHDLLVNFLKLSKNGILKEELCYGSNSSKIVS